MTTHDAKTLTEILEHDAALAVADAQAGYLVDACELAPLSYVAMAEARDAGTLDALLASVPAELMRAQAVRFLVERRAATGALWGWGDVDDVAGRFARAASRGRGQDLAARIGAAQAAALAAMMKEQTMPETITQALVERLLGELNALERLPVAEWEARPEIGRRYDALSARLRALGCEIGPDGDGGLCLYDPATQRPLEATPTAAAPAPVASPITPTATQLDAALRTRQEEAEDGERRARDVQDGELAKIARNSAAAYRNARADVALADAEGRTLAVMSPSGDLLVRSSSRGSVWHSVGRRPLDGSDYSPIQCSCEHGREAKLGICRHIGLYEGWLDAVDLAVADTDDAHDRAA